MSDHNILAALEKLATIKGGQFKIRVTSATRLLEELERNGVFCALNRLEASVALALATKYARRKGQGWEVWYPAEAKVLQIVGEKRPGIGLAMARAALKREREKFGRLESFVHVLEGLIEKLTERVEQIEANERFKGPLG